MGSNYHDYETQRCKGQNNLHWAGEPLPWHSLQTEACLSYAGRTQEPAEETN